MVLELVVMTAVAAGTGVPVKLAAPGLTSVNLSNEHTAYYSDHLAQQVGLCDVRVTTSAEIGTLLGLERQKQLLACGESSSQCITELAGALGVDGVITGSVGKFGTVYQVNVKVLSARDGTALAAASSRAEGSEVALLDELTRLAKMLAAQLSGHSPELTRPAPLAKDLWWAPAAAGVLAAGTGTVFYFQAKGRYDALMRGPAGGVDLEGMSPQEYAEAGRSQQVIGVALLGAGAVALGAAGLMVLTGDGPADSPASVALVPGPGSLSVVGVFP